MQRTRQRAHTGTGFTLVELIVVVGIFTIITTIALANHHRFGDGIFLTNLTYDIALSIRQAQVYGTSVREFEPTESFELPYGVYFDSPTMYRIFADGDGSGEDNNESAYTDQNEDVEVFNVTQGNTISELAVREGGSFTPIETTSGGFLEVLFERPDPDAIIRARVAGGALVENYAEARITVMSPEGQTREITVNLTGQISVN